MKISYKKLWKMLIDKDIKKKDLALMTGISTTSIAKMKRGENIQTDILVKICKSLDCDIADIAEIDRGDN